MRADPLPAMLWVTATLMVAGLVHLASILIMPQVATGNAFARVARLSGLNSLTLLPSPVPGRDVLPFRDPALASALCRYDLSEGALRIGVAVGDAAFLTLSFHSPEGIAYYALTNRFENDGRIDLLLLAPGQLAKIEAAAGEDEQVNDIRVTAPDPRGFVEFDVLPRIGGYAAARQVLNSASCKLERDP